MDYKKTANNLATLIVLLFLSGCVAGQSIKMSYEQQQPEAAKYHGTIFVQVKDDRPYIVNGDKDPAYIGHYRAGFGNTWDVKTSSNEPLATIMERDLTAKLEAMGFHVANKEKAKRVFAVAIKEWNFDTYVNGKYWIHCEAKVLDENQNMIFSHKVENNGVIRGSFWVGAKYAFEREMPVLYKETIDRIINGNPEMTKQLEN